MTREDAHSFFWDLGRQALQTHLVRPWASPFPTLSARQRATTFFAMRALRRTHALTLLFHNGLYAEAFPIVRSAYEDWVATAFLVLEDGSTRAELFSEDVWKLDQSMLRAFAKRAQPEEVVRMFADVPAEVQTLDAARQKDLKPWNGRTWKDMATDVGLGDVHDIVYTFLSAVSHGSWKGSRYIFEGSVARIPARNPDLENMPAMWAYWFQLRTLTIAARELGHHLEPWSDSLLKMRSDVGMTLTSSVLVRERGSITTAAD